MTHCIRKIALGIGLAAPVLAASASKVMANDTATLGGYCTEVGCVGGVTLCAIYEYPDGGKLTCTTTVIQT